jgi:small GTP-binding protein
MGNTPNPVVKQESIRVRSDAPCKVLLIGDDKVGKTSMIDRFFDNKFHETYLQTIGCDFRKYEDNDLKMLIWDLAGAERFRSIVTSYFRGAAGIFVVYDISNRQSFENIKGWMDSIDVYVSDKKEIKFVLVGNKTDLDKERKVTQEEGVKMAKQYNMEFFETSVKDNTNIIKCIDKMTILLRNSSLGYTNEATHVSAIK